MSTEKCPICGKLNEGLNLEETKGQYECSNCKTIIHVKGFGGECVAIPIIKWEDLPKLVGKL